MDDNFVPADPIWVAAVALVNESGTVLMQQRAPGSEHGSLWEFPGGKLEAGESVAAAAVRELAEELGILIDVANLQPLTFACGLTGSGAQVRSLTILLFVCANWQGEPEAHAATQIAWIAPGQLAGLRMPPLDYPLARALVKMLGSDVL